ncbi:complement C1q tumor necrosis factor-related protein 4 [Petromyzon marinus]|uniref:complement C1q tumor necrosis factor-related protein 4 n=1 Tax=Petromyzon marinus TaxID=7757 RepID=UPI003F708CCE
MGPGLLHACVSALLACAALLGAHTAASTTTTKAGILNPGLPFPGTSYPGEVSAFSAARTRSQIGGPRLAVTFDRVFVNLGQDFSAESGAFTCRVPGAYYFAFTVGKYPRKLLSVMLVKNRNEVQVMVYDDHRRGERKTQSQSVMLLLRRGERVWLRLHGEPRYALYSSAGAYTTFTGYLVYAVPSGDSGPVAGTALPASAAPRAPRAASLVVPSSPAPSPPVPPAPPATSPAPPAPPLPQEPRSPATRSAFSAARTSSLAAATRPSAAARALSFDAQLVDIGGDFDAGSGVFTCRVPGLYFFAFTVAKAPGLGVSVALMRNRDAMEAVIGDSSRSARREMQSQSALLRLDARDRVWLHAPAHPRLGLYSNAGRCVTFSGMLLLPLAGH